MQPQRRARFPSSARLDFVSVIVAKQKRYEQPADPSVPVEEGMYRFKLHMGNSGTKKHRQPVIFGVEKTFKLCHAVGHGGVWRRHENGVAGPSTANPILRAAKFAWCLRAASSL